MKYQKAPDIFLKTTMKKITFLLSMIFGRVAALQCEIPGECIGQFIGSTSQNSSTECLATCKGTSMNGFAVNNINIQIDFE